MGGIVAGCAGYLALWMRARSAHIKVPDLRPVRLALIQELARDLVQMTYIPAGHPHTGLDVLRRLNRPLDQAVPEIRCVLGDAID